MLYLIALLFIGFLVSASVVTLFIPSSGELEPDEPLVAARHDFDRMMVRKGLVTNDQLELIRRGVRSRAVVTGMRTTGTMREDHREVELDVMVKRPAGGQFAAHEKALIPTSALTRVSPGSVIDTYYRIGDESAVAVCVPPR